MYYFLMPSPLIVIIEAIGWLSSTYENITFSESIRVICGLWICHFNFIKIVIILFSQVSRGDTLYVGYLVTI